MGGALDSGSSDLSLSPGWATLLFHWAKGFTPMIVPLSIQVYKWVLANLLPGITYDGLASHPGGRVEILLVALCYRNWDAVFS